MSAETEENEPADDSSNSDTTNTPGGKVSQSTSSQLEQIIQRLPTCVNRDFIDEVSSLCDIRPGGKLENVLAETICFLFLCILVLCTQAKTMFFGATLRLYSQDT